MLYAMSAMEWLPLILRVAHPMAFEMSKLDSLHKNECLKGPDSVEKVADFVVLELWSRAPAQPFQTGFGTILASFLRFWAVAAIWNCSVAPFGPRRRIIVIPIYRFRWANSISTLLR